MEGGGAALWALLLEAALLTPPPEVVPTGIQMLRLRYPHES